MDVTYFASYREDTRGVTSRAIIKEQGIFTCRSLVSGRPCLIAWSRSPARCPLHPESGHSIGALRTPDRYWGTTSWGVYSGAIPMAQRIVSSSAMPYLCQLDELCSSTIL